MVNLFRKCPICEEKKAKELINLKFNFPQGNPLPRKSRVVCCANCGFTFADAENVSQSEYNEYYSKFNMYSENEELKENSFAEIARYVEGERLLASIGKDAKIIDLGCGGGGFLVYLKSQGYNHLTGLDPSEESINKLSRMGINGVVGNIFDCIPKNLEKHFDVVISTMVIEHIYDLKGYMKQIVQFMKDDEKSMLILNAPAVEGFAECPYPIANFFNHEHINYFSVVSIDNLLRVNELERKNGSPYIYENGEKHLLILCQKKQRDKSLEKDNISEREILKYLECINKAETNKKIQKVLNFNRKVVIWGCGAYAIQILAMYPELLNITEYFIDNNTTKHGVMFKGKEIKGPNVLLDRKDEYIILICSMRNAEDIEEQICEMNLAGEVISL